MEKEPETETQRFSKTPPRLPILSEPMWLFHADSSGNKTPPLGSMGSVPFKWEERPGRPKKCVAEEMLYMEEGFQRSPIYTRSFPDTDYGRKRGIFSFPRGKKLLRFCGLGEKISEPGNMVWDGAYTINHRKQHANGEISDVLAEEDDMKISKFGKKANSNGFKMRYAKVQRSSSRAMGRLWRKLRSVVHPAKGRN